MCRLPAVLGTCTEECLLMQMHISLKTPNAFHYSFVSKQYTYRISHVLWSLYRLPLIVIPEVVRELAQEIATC